MKNRSFIPAALSALLLSQLNAYAQKLPNKQVNPVLAPANIKIDGKDNEWGGYQAYNKATMLYYTMANDQNNLYLVVRAEDKDIVSKSLSGGITLVIKTTGKDKSLAPVSVTFPLIEMMEKSGVKMMIRNKDVNQDSMLIAANARLEKSSKEIAVSGIKQISDMRISVYNDYNIKTNSLIDAKRAWTYELQMPLKYFSDLVNNAGTFDYQVIVNGVTLPKDTIVIGGSSLGSGGGLGGITISDNSGFDPFNPTDFTASYTLARK